MANFINTLRSKWRKGVSSGGAGKVKTLQSTPQTRASYQAAAQSTSPSRSQEMIDQLQQQVSTGPQLMQVDQDSYKQEQERVAQEQFNKRRGLASERAGLLRTRLEGQRGYTEQQAGKARTNIEQSANIGRQKYGTEQERIDQLFASRKQQLEYQRPEIEREAEKSQRVIEEKGTEQLRQSTAQRAKLGAPGLRSGGYVNEQDRVRRASIEAVGDVQLERTKALNEVSSLISQTDIEKSQRLADLSLNFQQFEYDVQSKLSDVEATKVRQLEDLTNKIMLVDFDEKETLSELDIQQQESVQNAVQSYIDAVDKNNEQQMNYWSKNIAFMTDLLDAQLNLDEIQSKEHVASLKSRVASVGSKAKTFKGAEVLQIAEEDLGLTRRTSDDGGYNYYNNGQPITVEQYTQTIQGSITPSFTIKDALSGSVAQQDVDRLYKKTTTTKEEESGPY